MQINVEWIYRCLIGCDINNELQFYYSFYFWCHAKLSSELDGACIILYHKFVNILQPSIIIPSTIRLTFSTQQHFNYVVSFSFLQQSLSLQLSLKFVIIFRLTRWNRQKKVDHYMTRDETRKKRRSNWVHSDSTTK